MKLLFLVAIVASSLYIVKGQSTNCGATQSGSVFTIDCNPDFTVTSMTCTFDGDPLPCNLPRAIDAATLLPGLHPFVIVTTGTSGGATFRLTSTITISGAAQLSCIPSVDGTDLVVSCSSGVQIQSYTCTFDGATPQPCTIPGRFDLTSFTPGSHTLVVNGLVTGTNTMLMSGTITFSGAQSQQIDCSGSDITDESGDVIGRRFSCTQGGQPLMPVSSTCSIDGGAPEPCEHPIEVFYSDFSAGSHTLIFAFTTAGGASGSITTIFQVPQPDLGAQCTSSREGNFLIFECTADVALDTLTIRCQIDGVEVSNCTLPLRIDTSLQTVGDHTVRILFSNAEGAASTFTATYTVSETIPVNCLGVLGSLRCDSIVDPNGTCYTASYAVQRDDSVTFIVSARTPANTWVGLGVSDDRLMPNSDIVLGASDGTNSFIHDRFAFARAEPPIDPIQNIRRASVERAGGITTITFNRLRSASENLDISLDPDRFFLFAYSGIATFSAMPPTASFHGPGLTRRAPSQDRIHIPTFEECSGGVTPEPFTLDCQGGTDTANNIVFDCTSNTDLTTVDLQCFLNDVEQSTCTFPVTFSASELGAGVHNYTVVGMSNGVTITQSIIITIGSGAFMLDCSGAQENGNIVFDCSSTDIELADATLQCILDGAQQPTCDLPVSFSAAELGDGEHNFTIVATANGVTVIRTVIVTVTIGAPFMLDCSGSEGNGNIVFDCSSTDIDLTTATLQCILDGVQQPSCDLPVSFSATELGDGEHNFTIVATANGVTVIRTIIVTVTLPVPASCRGVLGSLRCDSIVDPNGTCYTASYTVQRDDSVTFTVSARTPANTWVGLGVSDDRLMPNSDIVLGASDGTNSFIHDRYAFARAEPPIDPIQNIGRASVDRADGITTMTFNRLRSASENLDISLDPDRFFLFAYSGIATFSAMPPTASFHGPGLTRRAPSQERIHIPTFRECSAVPQPIDIQCSVTPNAELTLYSYSCEVIIGDSPQDTLVCSVDGVPREPCLLIDSIDVFDFAPGVHTATITVTDTQGNSVSQSFEFTTPEPLVLTCGAVGPPLVVDCTGNNPASSILCQYDSGPFFDCNFPLTVDQTLPVGPHNLTVVYTDTFGQTDEEIIPFSITAPQPIDIQCSVTPNAALTVYSYSCGVIIGDSPQDTLVCSVDGVPREPCLLIDSIDVFDFAPGGHTATITVTDTLGNSASQSFEFTTPEPLVLTCGAVGPPLVVNCTGNNPASSIQCQYDSGPFFDCNFPLTVDQTLPAGPHNLTVVYTDTFGQTAEQIIPFSIAAPQPIDIQCSVTSNAEMTVYSYACGVIIGDSPQDTLVCSVDGVPREPCLLIDSIDVFDFAPGGHTATITVTDTQGNSASQSFEFTTPEPLVLTCGAVGPPLVVNCTGNNPASSIQCQYDSGPFFDCNFPLTVDQTLPVGPHNLTVVYTDTFGQTAEQIIPFSIAAPQPIDIQCSVTPNAEMTVYSYSCGVIIGDSPQDTLVCSVDGVPREPCLLIDSINVFDFAPGGHTATITVTDTQGNSVSQSFEFTTPEPLVLTCGAVGPPLVVDCTGNNPASSILCQYDSGPFFDCNFPLTVDQTLPVGPHNLTVVYTDTFGQTDEEIIPFSIAAPQPIDIQCSVTPNAALTVYSYSCGVIIGDSPQDTLVCSVDGVPREPCLLIDSIDVFDFAPGGHTATITVTDTLGNSASQSFEFTTPEPLVLTCSAVVPLVVDCAGNNPASSIQCQYDSGPFFDCDFPLTFDPTLPAGPHNLTVVYTDTFGQTAEQTISFTTPEPLVLTCGVVGPPLVVECTGNNPAFSIQCQYDSGPFFFCDFPLTVDPTLPVGPHNLTVVYIDTFEQTAEQTIPFSIGAFQPIDIQCSVTPNAEMTVYSYSCGVIIGDSPQDTLVCSVDGVPREPCLLVDSIDVFDFAPGVHTATITVTDTLGSSASQSFEFTTPEPLGLSCFAFGSPITFDCVTTQPPSSIRCQYDFGPEFDCDLPLAVDPTLPPGPHTLRVVYTDTFGRTREDTVSFFIAAPLEIELQCSFATLPELALYSYFCQVIPGDAPQDTLVCTVDGVPVVPCPLSDAIDVFDFAPGDHTFAITVNDTLGNSDSASFVFTTPEPLVLICGVSLPPLTYDCFGNNPASSIQCQYDSGPFFDCDFPLVVDQTLPIGPHTLRVVYNDTFGQTAEETLPFDIDPLCPPPPLIDHGTVAIAGGGNTIGDVASYFCDEGFELIGNASLRCERLDDFTAAFRPDPPICSPLCPPPPLIAHGAIMEFTGNSVGDTVHYVCNDGFKIKGPMYLECQKLDNYTAAFQPEPPVCHPICPNPPEIDGGTVNVTGNCVGDTAHYTCDDGLVLNGSPYLMCEKVDNYTAEFRPAPPECLEPGAIDIRCNLSVNSEMTVYSYFCAVFLGDGEQDTLVCSVDGDPREPCLLVDTINVFDFAPGGHTATITVTDTLGSSDSESFDFTTPEALVLTCGAVGPPIVITCDGNNPASSIQCQYDSGPFFDCDFPLTVDPTLPVGPHNLTVVYTDTFGQTAEEIFPFFITAPRPIQIDCDLASDIEMTLFLYSCGVTIGDSPQDTLVCDVDGVPRVPCLLEDTIDVFDFAPGVHTATITVTDTLGSSDSESFDFTTPEPLVLTCGAVGPPLVFDCTGNNPPSSIQCQYDTGPFFDCDFPLAVDPTLIPGPHILRVVYNDTFGQTAEETIPFSIDAPQEIDIQCTLTPNDDFTIYLYACGIIIGGSPNFTLVCDVDGVPREPCLLIDSINVFDFAPGVHTATITVTDTLGSSDSESFDFFTPGVCISETEGVSVRVECPGSGSVPGVDGFMCSLDGGNFFGCMPPFRISALSEGPHTIEVVGTRADGNGTIPFGQSQFLIDGIDLYFINDTPQVDGTGILHAQFRTNRPDSDDVELTCRLVGRTGRDDDDIILDSTQDCGSGNVTYNDLPLADYVLRVIANDTANGDRAVIRAGVWIVGNNDFCTITAINRRVTVFGNNATIEFGNTGAPNGFVCRLDQQRYSPCSSPVMVTNLSPGEHRLRIRPTGCGRPGSGLRRLSVFFEV